MAKKEETVEKVEIVEIKAQTIPNENEEDQRKGLSIASMVLGIVSLVIWANFLISVTCGILAIVFGNIGKKRAGQKMAKAGFIMGIIALSIRVALVVLTILAGGLFLSTFRGLM